VPRHNLSHCAFNNAGSRSSSVRIRPSFLPGVQYGTLSGPSKGTMSFSCRLNRRKDARHAHQMAQHHQHSSLRSSLDYLSTDSEDNRQTFAEQGTRNSRDQFYPRRACLRRNGSANHLPILCKPMSSCLGCILSSLRRHSIESESLLSQYLPPACRIK
jgi:hypothetical protein